MTAVELRLLAHILSIAALLAAMLALTLAGRRGLDMRYRAVLVAALGCYAIWFLLLSVSIRDAELIRRGEMTWVFGGVELTGGVLGCVWLALTVRKTFRLVAEPKRPQRIGKPTHKENEEEKGDTGWPQVQVL